MCLLSLGKFTILCCFWFYDFMILFYFRQGLAMKQKLPFSCLSTPSAVMTSIHHHGHLHFSTNKQNLVSALEDFEAKNQRMEKLGSEDNSWVLWSRSMLWLWLVNKWGCGRFSTRAFPGKQIMPEALSSTLVSYELAESSQGCEGR